MSLRPNNLASTEYAPGPSIMRHAVVNKCNTAGKAFASLSCLSGRTPKTTITEQAMGVNAPQSTNAARAIVTMRNVEGSASAT